MSFFTALLHNRLLVSAVLSWFLAQLIKGLLFLLHEHQLSANRFLGSGGMPSSHSATVTALTVSSGMVYGVDSGIFALSFLIAAIVIYDARGVRREAGKHGRMLNELQTFLQGKSTPLSRAEVFDELVGHTPLEIAAGMPLGVLVAVLVCL